MKAQHSWLKTTHSKVTIIRIVYVTLHQGQIPSLHFIVSVSHFLKSVTPSWFGFAIQGEL